MPRSVGRKIGLYCLEFEDSYENIEVVEESRKKWKWEEVSYSADTIILEFPNPESRDEAFNALEQRFNRK